MNKDPKNYKINLISNGNVIPFALTSIKNFDFLSTNFKDKKDLIESIKTYFNIDFPIDDIVVSYAITVKDKKTGKNKRENRNLEIMYNNYRGIVTDQELAEKLSNYIRKHLVVFCKLNLDDIKNSFLRDRIYSLNEINNDDDLDFALSKLKQHLNEHYKLKRDLSLFISKNKTPKPLTPMPADKEEIKKCYNNMDINEGMEYYFQTKIENNSPHKTGDPYLDYLLDNNLVDEIYKSYSIDKLELLGIQLNSNNGKSR